MYFKEHNFVLLNFYFILQKNEPNLLTDLDKYNLLHNKKITKDTKKLFLHHIIHGLCEAILKHKAKEKVIIYFSDHIPKNIELLKYYNSNELKSIFLQIINKIKKFLPIRIHINHLSFAEILQAENGELAEIIANIKKTIELYDITLFSFSKTNLFTKKQDLNFLNKEYFNTIKTKQLLLA